MSMTTQENEWREESEIAVFWDEMASFLPKSIERSALGDEKICNAFRAMYPKMKAHLLDQHSAHLVERIENMAIVDDYGEERKIGFQIAKDQAIDIIKDNK